MRLARPVFAGHKFLLHKGKVLNKADVQALSQRYPTLQVSVVDPLLDEVVSFQDDTRDAAVANYVRRQLTRTVQQARESLTADVYLRGMDFRAIEAAIVEVVRFLRDHPVTWAVLAEDRTCDMRLGGQTGNVFYLAMVLGNAIRCCILDARRTRHYLETHGNRPALDLAPLGLAALLMDISLWQSYPAIDHDGPLTDDERELIFNHPISSADMLPDGISPLTMTAIRQHHENHNGTGYPQKLAGSGISLYARTLRIADAYSAATSARGHRPAKSPVTALWEMTCGPFAQFYDPILLKVFQTVLQPYPIGAKVRLACGRFGVVVRHGRMHGLLPELVVAFDENEKPLPRRLLDGPCRLDQRPDVRIISFRGEDLTAIYSDDPLYSDENLSPPAAFQSLFESNYP